MTACPPAAGAVADPTTTPPESSCTDGRRDPSPDTATATVCPGSTANVATSAAPGPTTAISSYPRPSVLSGKLSNCWNLTKKSDVFSPPPAADARSTVYSRHVSFGWPGSGLHTGYQVIPSLLTETPSPFR